MKTLQVALGERSYPIYIGEQLLARPELYAPFIKSNEVVVVSNETVAPLYLAQVQQALADYKVGTVILPDGEKYKSLDTLNSIFSALLEGRFSRQVTVVALGGGVIGDMAGFAAACYQRGVPFIQVPTTLLSQVDSSVGGKTAVNHPMGKNMIGAFYQPRCVIADTSSLSTLDDRQLAAGIAEVIKYGLIQDREFYDWLTQNIERLVARESEALAYAIERSCQDKADVVAQDEQEQGVRALLNLGHTFGHAIEAGMGYGEWLHGEAVAAGMYMAAEMSARMGWISAEAVQEIEVLLKRANLPVRAPMELSVERMLDLMAVDKKVQAGKLRLVLLQDIGKAVVSEDFGLDTLAATLESCRA